MSRPLILMKEGELDHSAMRVARVSEEDILQSARTNQGVERLDEIRHVVLEISGDLSIIPRR